MTPMITPEKVVIVLNININPRDSISVDMARNIYSLFFVSDPVFMKDSVVMVIIARDITSSSLLYITFGSRFPSIIPVLKWIIVAMVIDVRVDNSNQLPIFCCFILYENRAAPSRENSARYLNIIDFLAIIMGRIYELNLNRGIAILIFCIAIEIRKIVRNIISVERAFL